LLAGAIVETGGDPADLPPVIYDRILEWFTAAAARPEPANDKEAETFQLLPEAFYRFEQAAMAALSRSAELRRSLPQKAAIQSQVRHYEQRYGFTNRMLSVLEDAQVVVLHPLTNRGWICRVDGISDNFQLHALLLDAFAGDGPDGIPGTRLAPEVARAAKDGPPSDASISSTWQLAQWTALLPDRTINPDHDAGGWIWNEGYPAEIEPFEGARVILIGPSTYTRSWDAGRMFPGLRASFTVEGRLPDAAAVIGEIAGRVTPRE
jgi:hypothetical protein